ncbi:MAG: N-acetylmuramoyl-L-alanine amidase [Lachnospiraceae bacterium]|nr:N-acetylmuramoyl-L-alanine amidase [Lachnospiraceae bacterium]
MDGIPTIIIDPGHGGQEPGAIFEGRKEKDDNLRLALAVGDILENAGIRVLYTRTSDMTQSLNEKAEIGNRSDADFFISLHRNAMPVPGSGSGVLTLIYEKGSEAEKMAENIQRNLVRTGFADLGIQERPGLAVLSRTRMPAVLVETGFIDNPEDNRRFDQNFQQIAQAIADGVITTFQQMEKPVYYQIQTGAYRNRGLAEQMEQQLRSQGFPVFLVYEDGWFKVRVGAFLNLDNAVHMEQVLRQYGYPTVMIRA